MSTTIKFNAAKIQDGWLCLKPLEYSDIVNSKAFCYGFNGVFDAELKKHYEKRSKNANSYAWVLITQIANYLRVSKEEIYLDMLKKYGQGGAVSVKARFADRFRRTYKYNESLGQSELKGEMWEHFRFWVGSSEYNTYEMSILIDGIVEEAKALDIETLSEMELSRLKDDWREEDG